MILYDIGIGFHSTCCLAWSRCASSLRAVLFGSAMVTPRLRLKRQLVEPLQTSVFQQWHSASISPIFATFFCVLLHFSAFQQFPNELFLITWWRSATNNLSRPITTRLQTLPSVCCKQQQVLGSEGCLGIITSAIVRVRPLPQVRGACNGHFDI